MPGWGKADYADLLGGQLAERGVRNRPYRFLREDQVRDVIATDKGYVRRQTYLDVHGNERTKEEVLIPSNQIDEAVGKATVVDAYSEVDGTTADIYLVFSEPVRIEGAISPTDDLEIEVTDGDSNTLKLASGVGHSNRLTGADNTIRFTNSSMTSGTWELTSNVELKGAGDVITRNGPGTERVQLFIPDAVKARIEFVIA